ncbi:hypothetical protein NMY22_g16359 [Coprinellus aureogranulatus]|nr:hypothetical protein NMY22_g16359 [Coprinellus aureogranulatus]
MVTWSLFSVLTLATLPFVASQSPPGFEFPSSWPHDYPGKPAGDYSPEWQSYFRVTDPLPNVTFPIPGSYAGNLPVNRGSPNNTLFFWGFEKSPGSLTDPAGSNNEPWGIWLNGGPGSSSMYGLFYENGPIALSKNNEASEREYSWDKIAGYFWIDQPVGVGYSTATSDGYVPDEDQVGKDFMEFLRNLVKVFPGLASRPLHITGESYAGTYIPYILKSYFEVADPPVQVASIAIGDGTMASEAVWMHVPTLSIIETFPQLIGYDPEVYQYFKRQAHICKYDLNLTYPQEGGVLPDIPVVQPTGRPTTQLLAAGSSGQRNLFQTLAKRYAEFDGNRLKRRDRELARELWKKDSSGGASDGLNPWYGCFLWDELYDYAVNFTYPFTESGTFDVHNVPDLSSPPLDDASVFLNDPATRKALHAPTSKDWALGIAWVFGPTWYDPSPVPMNFMTDLATNATAKGVEIVLFSGNNDFLLAHLGTEIVIQNTTFGGIQGFTRKPSTPWCDDSGKFAGIIHQERGWKYALFYGASHMVPASKPRASFKFARDFIFSFPANRVPSPGSRGCCNTRSQRSWEAANPPGPGMGYKEGEEMLVSAGSSPSFTLVPSRFPPFSITLSHPLFHSFTPVSPASPYPHLSPTLNLVVFAVGKHDASKSLPSTTVSLAPSVWGQRLCAFEVIAPRDAILDVEEGVDGRGLRGTEKAKVSSLALYSTTTTPLTVTHSPTPSYNLTRSADNDNDPSNHAPTASHTLLIVEDNAEVLPSIGAPNHSLRRRRRRGHNIDRCSIDLPFRDIRSQGRGTHWQRRRGCRHRRRRFKSDIASTKS